MLCQSTIECSQKILYYFLKCIIFGLTMELILDSFALSVQYLFIIWPQGLAEAENSDSGTGGKAVWLFYWKHISTAVQQVAPTASVGFGAPHPAALPYVKLTSAAWLLPCFPHQKSYTLTESSPCSSILSLLRAVVVLDHLTWTWTDAFQICYSKLKLTMLPWCHSHDFRHLPHRNFLNCINYLEFLSFIYSISCWITSCASFI